MGQSLASAHRTGLPALPRAWLSGWLSGLVQHGARAQQGTPTLQVSQQGFGSHHSHRGSLDRGGSPSQGGCGLLAQLEGREERLAAAWRLSGGPKPIP